MKRIILALFLALAAMPAAAGETGCVYDLKGETQIMKAGGAGWTPARKGLPVAEGDRVRTGPQAWCEILFKDGSFIKMEADSETAAEELKVTAEERVFSFSFLKGKALWMAAKLKKKATSKFSVRTPSAVCAVRGTDFSMIVSTAGETTVGLFEGKVAVSDAAGEKELLAGGEASAGAGGVAVQARLSRLMKAEERRYARVKGRVESLRKRLAERDTYLDEYITRQEKALSDFDLRRRQKLGKQ